MKKILFILALAASLLPAAAFLTGIFPGWDNLIAQSPDIVIARCVATQDRSNLLGASFAAPVLSQIEVLSVLKGNLKTGPLQLRSLYWPHPGDYFLAFSGYTLTPSNNVFNAIEEYRILPMQRLISSNQLAGNSLQEQVRIIVRQRAEDLDREIAHAKEEKDSMEGRVKPLVFPGSSTNKSPGSGTF